MNSKKPQARLVIPFWGKLYVREMLDLTLPALLSPGNLPKFVQDIDCEIVLVTQERWFEQVMNSKVIQELEKIVKVRLVAMDDLLCKHYGVTLTMALYRGFSDLGTRMTEYYILFLNADFIVADGSYGKLASLILKGEKLIFAPSYCVSQETVVPELHFRKDLENHVLAIPRRKMASLALKHRHRTIRAKTLNQRMYSMTRQDQFYWYGDDHLLLGRQMPISLICMRPEIVHTSPTSFWDFAVVDDICPTVPHCVIGDSDDYLMIELRKDKTFQEMFRLGYSSVEDVANDMASYAPQNHYDMGRYPLYLHDRELPDNLESIERNIESYMDDLYRHTPKTLKSRNNHEYWTSAYLQFLEQQGTSTDSSINLGGDPQKDGFFGLCKSWAYGLYKGVMGVAPEVHAFHPAYIPFKRVIDLLDQNKLDKAGRYLLVSKGAGIFENYFSQRSLSFDVMEPDDFDDIKLADPSGLTQKYDLCLCEINTQEMTNFTRLPMLAQPLLKERGEVVAFVLMENPIHFYEMLKIIEHTPGSGTFKVFFSGGFMLHLSRKLLNHVERLIKERKWPVIMAPFLFAASMVSGLIGNLKENKRAANIQPKLCTSMILHVKFMKSD